MADDYNYTYELYSNSCCPSSLQNASTRVRLQQGRGWLMFDERIDLHFGMLDKLLANGVLNVVEYDNVKASQSSIIGDKKFIEYLKLAKNRPPYADYNVALAAESTKQRHLLNYLGNSGMYNRMFGGDWPLTDRQMMALNVNQEILLELMEMSPGLIEELYSRNVLTKRHKDFICGQLSEFKKTETFLDILRRRSFRDYKETIKCLRASNQKHIAEILEGGAVMRIHAFCTLKRSRCHTLNRSTTETVVRKFSEELKKRPLDGGDKKLQLTRIGLIDVKFDNAIVFYFQCKTNNDFMDLKTVYDTLEINTILLSDIRMLLSRDHDEPFTAMIERSEEDYNRCDCYLRCRPFSDTCMDGLGLHVDVLEIILSKAYALYFYRVQPRPRDKDMFAMLSSVSQNWHKTIYRHWFKASLNRCLSPYFLQITKRQTIIRSNRQYLVENMDPSSSLINRLEQVGCLTTENANYIRRLQYNTAKNNELLNVARTMSCRKHVAFVESLHLCGQLKVADVLERGGVVFKTLATCSGVSTDAEFITRLNEKISETTKQYTELEKSVEPFDVKIPKELEILEVQPLGRIRGEERIVIWLWCKSKKSLRQICKLAKSDQLLRMLNTLMAFVFLKGTEHRIRSTLSLQFLKKLSLGTMQFQSTFAVRQLSVKCSGQFNNLPLNSYAMTSLDDKFYVLTDNMISVHQCVAPYALQSRTVFPSAESPEVYPGYHDVHGWFIKECLQTQCIYVTRRHDQHLWKLTTPECNLEVWMHCIASLCSLAVTGDGNVIILKIERQDGVYCLEMLTKDAVLLHIINLDVPLPIVRPDSLSVVEISPGNFAINCQNNLLVKSVNFATLTTTDQNRIRYPNINQDYGSINSMALYSANRLIVVVEWNRLAICDSRLNVEICTGALQTCPQILHYRKDRRQLMVYSPITDSVQIYTFQYEDEKLSVR